MNIKFNRISHILILLAFPLVSMAHGPVARVSETVIVDARLFAADRASGDVIAVDLPAGDQIMRLSTPPYIMQFGLSQDRRHLFAMRGRDTDRDFVTIISTGFDPDQSTFSPPYIARTLLGYAPGGIRSGKLSTVGGRDAIFMEGSAEIVVVDGWPENGFEVIDSTTYQLANPDHYHYLESGANLYVGHLRSGIVQILNRDSGAEVGRISGCPGLHGMARDDETGRLLFSCTINTVIVGSRGTETSRELGRIEFPMAQRPAAFLYGKDRVLWGYTEGTIPVVYRLDLKVEPWAFDVVPVPRSIRQAVSASGEYFMVLTRAGELQMHDGGSGELLRKVRVSAPIEEELDEHVDKAILPGITTLGTTAFVSLPHMGRIAEVNMESGELIRYIETGGEPTRLVVVTQARPATYMVESKEKLVSRWYTDLEARTGTQIYQLNCAVCHGDSAQGNYGNLGDASVTTPVPPPSLDGSGHSANHSLEEMLDIINNGSDPVMPAFGDLLTEDEKRAVIAYSQTFWSDDVYARWHGQTETGGHHP